MGYRRPRDRRDHKIEEACNKGSYRRINRRREPEGLAERGRRILRGSRRRTSEGVVI